MEVLLKDCLKDIDQNKKELPIILGKDAKGNTVIKDLTEIGSVLISGATGSGKSVFIQSVIYTLLKTKSPQEVRFINIDVKMQGMPSYDGVPHLLSAEISDTEEAYKVLTKIIEDKVKNESPVVIFFEDIADLILGYGKEAEDLLIKIATEGKELGIYMLLATSRPAQSVLTERLREAIPNRIAFALASENDSMLLLEQLGGEGLLGNGDMIYRDLNTNETVRVQAPFVSYEEMEELVKELTPKSF